MKREVVCEIPGGMYGNDDLGCGMGNVVVVADKLFDALAWMAKRRLKAVSHKMMSDGILVNYVRVSPLKSFH